MSEKAVVPTNLTTSFGAVSDPDLEKKPTPFSLRLTREERARLDALAGAQPLGSYIRGQLLGENAKKRRKSRKPRVSDQKLSFVLSLLGEQRIASNLNQLAKHANIGTLDVDNDVIEQLQEACAAMIAIRNFLLDIEGEE